MNAPHERAAMPATASPAATVHAGFGNHFESEALPGALPVGRNNPQRPAHGLFTELFSGTAFTAPREGNRRTWLYRRRPSAVVGPARPYAQPWIRTGAAMGLAAAPDPMRWHPPEMTAADAPPVDFVDGLRTMVVNGDPANQTGVAVHVYRANVSMRGRAFACLDGELLFVPQHGAITLRTELGVLVAAPGDIALVPRGMVFRVEVDGPVRGFVTENHGAAFRLPELGPIGSNGLANPRDFVAPTAALEADAGPVELVRKSGGALWASTLPSTPFDVAAWHGNLVPMVYDTRRFNTMGTVSFDHPDPSIFTVLTSPSDTPGWANADFVIFPPRWMVAEDTFRPPWYHRNVMSEFMGLVYGQYDAKPEGFRPGGMSLHNSFVPHGPDAEAFDKATQAALAPHKLDHTLAFMVESRWPFRLTEFALHGGLLDERYLDCWAPLATRPLP